MSSAYQNNLPSGQYQSEMIRECWGLTSREKSDSQGITAVQTEVPMELNFMRIILFLCVIIVMGVSVL